MMGSIMDVNVVLMLIICGPILAFVPVLIKSPSKKCELQECGAQKHFWKQMPVCTSVQ